MNNEIKIARMTPSDIARVYSLELEIFSDDPWPIEWFQEGVNDPDGYYYVAYLNNEIVGYCGMYHIKRQLPNYSKIANLAVAEKFRNKGIGKTLMLKMLDTAKELGLEKTKLEVNTNNPAIKLYQSLGFKIIELKEHYYQKSGADGYIMWRSEKEE